MRNSKLHISVLAMAEIVVIDDSQLIRKLVRKLLEEEGHTVYEASCGKEGLLLVNRTEPDLVILDYEMPDMNGLEVLKELKEKTDAFVNTPVIILTSDNDPDKIVELLNAKASDYVEKGTPHQVLLARVRVQLRIKELLDELDEKNRKLQLMAETDELTGIKNRRYIMKRLEQEMSAAQRHGYPVALTIFDVDHFKKVNDTFGHTFGDFALKEIARIISGSVRLEDVVARYGGEEFIVLSPYTDKKGAYRLAERIRGLIAAHLFKKGNIQTKITISAGVASYPEDNVFFPDDLLKIADRRLYIAKERGRNRVVWEG